MPKSATGWTDRRSARRPPLDPAGRCRVAGYTLIEILVVVVIAGVLAGVALLQFSGDRTVPRLSAEAERIDARLTELCDRALLTGAPHGVRLTASGYDFWQRIRSTWQPLPALERPAERNWPNGLRAELVVEGQRVSPTTAERPQLVCSALEPMPVSVWTLRLDGANLRFEPLGASR